jgi:hypothetical protein
MTPAEILAQLRDPDFRGPLRHCRSWEDLDTLMDACVEEIERLRRITTATLRILSASPDTPDIRDQLAAVIWESGYADTDAPGRITWPKLLEIAEDHAAWGQHRDRVLRQADAVLALPSVMRLLAVEAAARPCVAEITTYEEREALRRALSQ